MGVQQHVVHLPVGLPAGTRVLIVEDHPFVALAVADMIIDLGGEIADSVATIEAALAAVGRGGFTIALLDIDLGGHTSEPVAVAIAATDRPFLVTTGFDDQTIKGFEDAPLLMKPYLSAQLGAALMSLLTPKADVA